MISLNVKALLKNATRFLIAAIACVSLLFSSTMPAMAAGKTTPANPTEGEAQLTKILDESEDAAKEGRSSLQEVAERSERGLNEVQGSADYDKMKRPENSQNATSFIDPLKEGLKDASPKN